MNEQEQILNGQIMDVVAGRIFPGQIVIRGGRIASVSETKEAPGLFILPGLIDAHIHIESSMLIPSEFARLASVHGTTGTVSDPHEIANVLGMEGVRFMITNGKKVPFRFNFGAPSCVPATLFETAGATLGPGEVDELLAMNEIKYLSEMMNYPGVLNRDEDVLRKIRSALERGKPVDGHAPGLTGEAAAVYASAGITTDHECVTLEEAEGKIRCGMKILIREGSAARNFDALYPLIDRYPGSVMLCSDDKHPDDLVRGHINGLVRRALAFGCDPMNVFRTCTLNPIRHYALDAGLLQPGDPADLILADNLEEFNVLSVFVGGVKIAENGVTMIPSVPESPENFFAASRIEPAVLAIAPAGDRIRVLEARDGQLVTGAGIEPALVMDGLVVADPGRDILKLVVKDRYTDGPPAVAFVKGFGLNEAAIASCVAHDSHNIVAVGTDDELIARAINLIVDQKGGISLASRLKNETLPLPFAGIMSGEDGYIVASTYEHMDMEAKNAGSGLRAPFMTLSFMALLVIPEFKLSDKGFFDGKDFTFTSIFA